MNEFDQFVKHKLKVKHYCRYTDDFVIVSSDRRYLEDFLLQIEFFLKSELDLQLRPNKISIRKVRQGIDFLGYVILPHYRILRTKTKRRMIRKVCAKNLASYLGLLKHCCGYKLEQKIKENINYLELRNETFTI